MQQASLRTRSGVGCERCVLCNSCEVDVEHFLVRCKEFRWERQALLEKIRQMKGT